MEFDFALIAVGLVTSGIGFVYFSYGKRQSKLSVAACGAALMGYPYFVDNVWVSIGIGAALSAVPFVLKWW